MEIIVILNNIRSNQNVGSIFRTADAVGISKIILVGYTPAPLDRFGRENTGLTKASLGAEKSVKWQKVSKLSEAVRCVQNSLSAPTSDSTYISLLRNSLCSAQSASQGNQKQVHSTNFEHKARSDNNSPDFSVVAIEQNKKSIDFRKLKTSKLLTSGSKLALVFGNEVEGLSKEDLKFCDVVAQLPMLGQKESLNVAVCVGVVLYSLLE